MSSLPKDHLLIEAETILAHNGALDQARALVGLRERVRQLEQQEASLRDALDQALGEVSAWHGRSRELKAGLVAAQEALRETCDAFVEWLETQGYNSMEAAEVVASCRAVLDGATPPLPQDQEAHPSGDARACEYELVDNLGRVIHWGGTNRELAEKRAAELGLTVVENWRG